MQPVHTPRRSFGEQWLFLGVVLVLGISGSMLSRALARNEMQHSTKPAGLVTTIVLYNGSLTPGTPDQQHMLYLTRPQPASASHTFANGATTLTTTLKTSDIAGYSNNPFSVPAFDRALGFTLRFTVQLVEENHALSDKNSDGIDDRAGLSVTLLGSDHKGIELGFWPDEIWAQRDGPAEPPPSDNTLFTHGEGTAFNTTSGLIAYSLTIEGDTYTLESGGTIILSGPVRDYSVVPQPYRIGNFLFIGDNTGTADAIIKLSFVAIDITSAAPATATITTAVPSQTPSPTVSPTNPRVLLPVIRQDEDPISLSLF